MKVPGSDDAIDDLIRFLAKPKWQPRWDEAFAEHTATVCKRFDISRDELEKELSEYQHTLVFVSVFEDLISRRFETNRCALDEYLDKHGLRQSLQARDYLRGVRDSTLTLYEVVGIRRGHGLSLRNLFADDEVVDVDERAGSESVAKWDRVATRVVNYRGTAILSGLTMHFPDESSNALLELARAKRGAPAPAEFTEVWLTTILTASRAPRPQLLNAHAEPIEFVTARYTIKPGMRRAIAALIDAREDFVRFSASEWQWLSPEAPKSTSGSATMLTSTSLSGLTVLGTLALERANVLRFETNSRGRSERADTTLREICGPLIGDCELEVKSVAELLDAPRPDVHRARSRRAPGLTKDDEARFLSKTMDDHYRRVIDEPIPALNGLSPRSAASSSATRASVVRWLKSLENNEERRSRRDGHRAYDAGWIWSELGLREERG